MADFNKIDLNLLRVFQAILEERSLTHAGYRLGLSQPAISYALGRLRTLFDDPLFVRIPNGMAPTPTAEQLAQPVGRALAAVREALRHAEHFDAGSSTRTFRLSMSDIGEQVFLPPLCEKLQQVAPFLQLEAEQIPVTKVEEALRLGQLDFAVGNLPALKSVTRYALLFHEAYVCMTRKRAGLPQRSLSAQRFLELSHIAVSSSESSHRTIDDSLRAAGLHRRIALRVPHFTVIPQILQRTDWMVTLPRRVARHFNEHRQFAVYPLPVAIPEVEVTVHWHESFDNDDGNRWLREQIIDTLRDT
ncbi:LysR family transcriptional regulator [Pandoraea thiooxydans]|uniref:LysR family transcriptional regulator n=1 Tax=Pandoraea thiooxydans TaxID=445709 RepID=A0A0G3ENW2_9BURK|nr:LysR family transcriptional regulator [Pandoraea thiooxydans]AKJ66992.1 LysR family transcriptional regulator [Pandoraea thiooxydans]APR93901.1 LysR family transcriptional regulator [Pandoraea thiooxydans]